MLSYYYITYRETKYLNKDSKVDTISLTPFNVCTLVLTIVTIDLKQ